MTKKAEQDSSFVGIQISPISFIDEGVGPLMDTLKERFGIDVLTVSAISWIDMLIGRRPSWKLEGFPDHGVAEPSHLNGGAYYNYDPELYKNTFIRDFRATDPLLDGVDILATVIPEAHQRDMEVYPWLFEPLFAHGGHKSSEGPQIPNLIQTFEIDAFGGIGDQPCLNNPDYRNWWLSIIEDLCTNYDIDGISWCNERRSPIDNVLLGKLPNCFCKHCQREATERGIDVERAREGLIELYDFVQEAHQGTSFPDGALVEFLRRLYRHPEIHDWEKYWVERNKDLDRELYGLTKQIDPELQFGLNVWNRNHFNPLRKAQWSWDEMADYADWVKVIVYQHQAGTVYQKEMKTLHQSVLRDVAPETMTPVMYDILGLDEAPWKELVQQGMDPDTYVYGQCADAVEGVSGKAAVYAGVGVNAPKGDPQQAECTPQIVYDSVKAAHRAGAKGIIYSPAYAAMDQSNLEGGAEALKELGWM